MSAPVECYFCEARAVTVVWKSWKVGGWVDVCLLCSVTPRGFLRQSEREPSS